MEWFIWKQHTHAYTWTGNIASQFCAYNCAVCVCVLYISFYLSICTARIIQILFVFHSFSPTLLPLVKALLLLPMPLLYLPHNVSVYTDTVYHRKQMKSNLFSRNKSTFLVELDQQHRTKRGKKTSRRKKARLCFDERGALARCVFCECQKHLT